MFSQKVCWALANLSGNDTVTRDLVLSQQGLSEALAVTLSSQSNSSSTATTETPQAETTNINGAELIKLSVWLISNLCRGSPAPVFSEVRVFLPALSWLLGDYLPKEGGSSETDPVKTQSIIEACWASSFIALAAEKAVDSEKMGNLADEDDEDSLDSDEAEGDVNECVEEALASGLAENLIAVLRGEPGWTHPTDVILIAGLRTLGSLLAAANGDQVTVSFNL